MANGITKSNYNLVRNRAGELLGQNPAITDRELCEKLNIKRNSLLRIKKDRQFYEKAEATFEQTITRDLLLVDVAMIREAQAGNVQAARYLAERHGKFIKKFQIEVKSPYELFAKELEIEDIDYEEIPDKTKDLTVKLSQTELPQRNKINDTPTIRAKKERKHLHKTLTRMKREKSPRYKADQKDRYELRKRSQAVNLAPLPKGRPKPHAKKAWLKKLYKLEEEIRQQNLDTASKETKNTNQ